MLRSPLTYFLGIAVFLLTFVVVVWGSPVEAGKSLVARDVVQTPATDGTNPTGVLGEIADVFTAATDI
ncbi:hypothetical protein RSAG8_11164, partial [Rhizoctonia solani AG-8 WAC10335]